MSSDWWAKKLGSPAPPRPQYPAPQMQQATVPNFPAPAPHQIHVQHETLTDALQDPSAWQGRGQAVRVEGNNKCPGCGGPNYFSRVQAGLLGKPPAPHCYDCGYPLMQSGSEFGGSRQAAYLGSQ